MNKVILNNGVEMPQMGYGVYQVSPAECEHCVSDALKVGYRMIDTAQAYHNEEGVGNAVQKSGIDRKEIFLVSKVHIKVFERRMRKVYWLSVTFLILVKSGEDRRRQEYDKMRQRNVTYP